MKRVSRIAGLLAFTALALAPTAPALDTILLRNGTRVTGTIYGQSKDRVFMRIGEGNAVFSKRAIRRIYEDITDMPPVTRVLRPEELPPWWVPLSDLYHEDWVNTLEHVPSSRRVGAFGFVPSLSFVANNNYELTIFGDPMNPAGIEFGFNARVPWWDLKAARTRVRRYLASYLSGLRQFETLYRMNDRLGSGAEVEGLRMEITPRSLLGGWYITISNPARVAAARVPDDAAWERANARNLTLVTRATGGETSWTKYTLTDAADRFLPLEGDRER